MKRKTVHSRVFIISTLLLCVAHSQAQINLSTTAWQTIYVKGRLSFSLPSDMEKVKEQKSVGVADERGMRLYAGGLDAASATYQNSRMRLSYEYAQSAEYGGYENQPKVKEEVVEIEGWRAKVVTHDVEGTIHGHRYFALMFLIEGGQRAGNRPQLVMWASCANSAEQEAAKKVFRSVKFAAPPA